MQRKRTREREKERKRERDSERERERIWGGARGDNLSMSGRAATRDNETVER
jgi:hypothetical protein